MSATAWAQIVRITLINSREEFKQQLYLINVESGERRAIGPESQGDNRITYLDVHPNGTTLSFSRGGSTSNVWTIENLVFDQ